MSVCPSLVISSTRCLSVAASQHHRGFILVDGYIDASRSDYHNRYRANLELRHKYQQIHAQAVQGGSENARKRHTQRKLLARDRIATVLDDGCELLELGTIMGHDDSLPGAGAGVVTGIGRINNRECMVTAHDATVKGGAIYPIGVQKQLRVQRLSRQLRIPSVQLVDTAGAFLPLQSEIFPDRNHGGRSFYYEAVFGAMGLPQLSVVLGSCTAGGAYAPTLTDNSIIVNKIGHVFLGGPPLVKAATGEVVSADDLGGAILHTRTSGASDYFASTEQEAFGLLRDLVTTVKYEPRLLHNDSQPLEDPSHSPLYSTTELDGLAGSTLGDRQFVFQVIGRVFDRSEFCEFRGTYGTGLVCGWARLSEKTVGVIAANGGKIDFRSAEKASQFGQMCDEAGTPLVILQRSLHDGWSSYDHFDLKAHAQLITVLSTVAVPRLVVNMGGVVGADYFVMVIGRVFDRSEFCEFRGTYGTGLVCGWARLSEKTVGVIAANGGKIDFRSAEKASQFGQMCDEAGTPLVILQRSLHDGWSSYDHFDLKAHAQLITVLSTVAVPRLVVNMGGVVGADYFVMSGRSFDAEFYFTWPNAGIREQATSSALGDDAFDAAHNNWVDDVIMPENTRKVLIHCLRSLPANIKRDPKIKRIMRL